MNNRTWTLTKYAAAPIAALGLVLGACGTATNNPAPPPTVSGLQNPAPVISHFGTPWNPLPTLTVVETEQVVPATVDSTGPVNSAGQHLTIPAHLLVTTHVDNHSVRIVNLGQAYGDYQLTSNCTTTTGTGLDSTVPGTPNATGGGQILPGNSGDQANSYRVPNPNEQVQCQVNFTPDGSLVTNHYDAFFVK